MAKRRSGKRRSTRNSGGRGRFSQPLSLLQPAVIGAAGALGVNAIVNNVPLPDMLKEGRMIYLTRAGIAVLLGMFGSRLPVVGRYAGDMARGALILTIADLGKEIAVQSGFNLSGTGYVGPGRIVRNGGKSIAGVNMYVGPRGAARIPQGMQGAGLYVGPGSNRVRRVV